MHFTNLLALAALAILPALAAPSAEVASLEERGQSCRPGLVYNGFHKGCKCENKNCSYDDHLKKCHYPSHPKPSCPHKQNPWCARGSNDFCKYNERDERCWDDGKSKVFCCEDKNIHVEAKKQCPPNPPRCPPGQSYDYGKRACACPPGKVLRHGKCRDKPLPRPHCPYGQKPYCAKDQHNYCDWDDGHDFCDDNGLNIAFCCAPSKVKQECSRKWN